MISNVHKNYGWRVVAGVAMVAALGLCTAKPAMAYGWRGGGGWHAGWGWGRSWYGPGIGFGIYPGLYAFAPPPVYYAPPPVYYPPPPPPPAQHYWRSAAVAPTPAPRIVHKTHHVVHHVAKPSNCGCPPQAQSSSPPVSPPPQ
jgi:hypothetical protein